MKLDVFCPCIIVDVQKGNFSAQQIELDDNRFYPFECNNGHKLVTYIQNNKYEILFELGLKALKDEYYIEAIANFHTSLERFNEFCIKLFLLHQDSSPPLFDDKLKEIDSFWKVITNQSERQYGLYSGLYYSVLKEIPQDIQKIKLRGSNSSLVAVRNSIIHKGSLSNRQQAIDFGYAVFEYIWTVLEKIREVIPNDTTVKYVLSLEILEKEKFYNKNPKFKEVFISTQACPSLVSFHIAEKEDYFKCVSSGRTIFDSMKPNMTK